MIDFFWAWSLLVVTALGYVWLAASLSAVFRKAGEEPWQAWVPILNAVVLLRLGGMSGWLLLLNLAPGLGQLALLVIFVVVYLRVSRSFGYGAGMTVLAALLLPVWTSILGWGSARWIGSPLVPHPGPRRGGESGALDARVAGPPAPGHAGPYGVPPRPPSPRPLPSGTAPEPSRPASVPQTPGAGTPTPGADLTSPWSFAPPPTVDPADPPSSVPTLRSTARGRSPRPAGELDEDSGSALPLDAPAPPATPRRAVPDAEPSASASSVPIHTVPRAPAGPPAADTWAPPVPATAPLPAVATRTLRSAPLEAPDGQFDTSVEISAVVGSPTIGAPRSARESVSSMHAEPEIPEADASFDETILATRRRTAWMLMPPLGAPIAVTGDVLIVGRRPAGDPDFADAQLIPISDETRTMSKTHARLELQGDGWVVIDLDSTNGVILVREDGSEVDATPGVPERLTERFLLGDAEVRLARADH